MPIFYAPIFLHYISQDDVVLKTDDTFLNSEEALVNEKNKYGLQKQEEFGLVILGEINNSVTAKYTTVLSSDRFLFFSNGNKNHEVSWSELMSVCYCGELVHFTRYDGSSFSISDKLFGDSIDSKNNTIQHMVEYIVSLINEEVCKKQKTRNHQPL